MYCTVAECLILPVAKASFVQLLFIITLPRQRKRYGEKKKLKSKRYDKLFSVNRFHLSALCIL